MRVLLCEDSDLNRKFILLALSRQGHETRVVADGANALREAGTGGYDLVIMDLNMPGMSGLEAARRIRSLPDPKADSVSPELSRAAADSGVTTCIGRPLGLERLHGLLQALPLNNPTACEHYAPTGAKAA